jgi:predicted RNA-binding protein YlxR (DUF448 family)
MPKRTCLGCRKAREKGALVRLALTPSGRVVPDKRAGLGGRGAYICPERSCVEAACRTKGAFSRAFRRNVPTPPQDADELFELMKGCKGAGGIEGDEGDTRV